MEYISTVGNTALWIAFAFMLFSSLTFLFLSYVRNVKAEARCVAREPGRGRELGRAGLAAGSAGRHPEPRALPLHIPLVPAAPLARVGTARVLHAGACARCPAACHRLPAPDLHPPSPTRAPPAASRTT